MALVHLQMYDDEAELLQTIQGIGSAAQTLRFLDAEQTEQALQWADDELQAMTQYGIQPLLYGTSHYPQRLMTCPDAPLVLYQLGPANLNATHVVSIVGTRHCTPSIRSAPHPTPRASYSATASSRPWPTKFTSLRVRPVVAPYRPCITPATTAAPATHGQALKARRSRQAASSS